ncbi:MAG TPA: copper resistance protein NlpE [Ferruginibacter sp.]|nr:copper resistance protein NlpE [Ferruginibacter sp.]
MKRWWIIGISSLCLFSCATKEENIEPAGFAEDIEQPLTQPVAATSAPADSTASVSLAIEGIYKGMLPCADCKGLETTLELKPGLTFTLSRNHSGNREPIMQQGSYTDLTGGNIRLEGLKGESGLYLVQQGKAYQLDPQGRIIKGSMAKQYVLRKN